MSIRFRLLTGMAMISVLFLAPLLGGLWTMERMRDQTTQMRDREFAASVVLARVRSNVQGLRRTASGMLTDSAPAMRDEAAVASAKLVAMATLLDSYGLRAAADSLRSSIG